MIRVNPQPEPSTFDSAVRQPGLKYLNDKKINLTKPVPAKTKIKACWSACLDDLHKCYQGHCAYLAVYFERATGGATVEHFVAKSQQAGRAYDWDNYRLASSIVNSRKRAHADVLDPFDVQDGDFHLELVSGKIYPNPQAAADRQAAVTDSIDRMGLDDARHREMRARHFQEYSQGDYTADYLKRRSPFVWLEADRQGLL